MWKAIFTGNMTGHIKELFTGFAQQRLIYAFLSFCLIFKPNKRKINKQLFAKSGQQRAVLRGTSKHIKVLKKICIFLSSLLVCKYCFARYLSCSTSLCSLMEFAQLAVLLCGLQDCHCLHYTVERELQANKLYIYIFFLYRLRFSKTYDELIKHYLFIFILTGINCDG